MRPAEEPAAPTAPTVVEVDEQREQSASSYLLCGMSPCAGEPPSDAPSELPPEPAKPRPDERAPRREVRWYWKETAGRVKAHSADRAHDAGGGGPSGDEAA